jgi:putative transposase
MTQQQRLMVPAGTYYISARLEDRASTLLVDQIDLLRAAVRLCQKRWPFIIEAAVVLPAAVQMIWTLPPGDCDAATRWRLIRSAFARHVEGPATAYPDKATRGNMGVWQRRFDGHLIGDPADLQAHRTQIMMSPLRAGLVTHILDWPYASVHRDLRRALIAPTGPAPTRMTAATGTAPVQPLCIS